MHLKQKNQMDKLTYDLKSYLCGGMKLKDVCAAHKITPGRANNAIKKILSDKFTMPTIVNEKKRKSIPNDQIREVIAQQLERERQWRVTEEITQTPTIIPEHFLNSRLINSTRIYGTE